MPSKSRRRPVASDRRFRRPEPGIDYGPRERWQHAKRILAPLEAGGVHVARVADEHSVDILESRGVIDACQREAALRFKADFHAAALSAHVTSGYNPASVTRDNFHAVPDRAAGQERAYRRWRKAMRELGVEANPVMVTVLCHDLPPTPREIPLLRQGLDILVKFYGVAGVARA